MLQMLVEGHFRSIPWIARRVAFWQRYRGCAFCSRLIRYVRSPIHEIRRYLRGLLGGDGNMRRLG
jgi:hypothetical protein